MPADRIDRRIVPPPQLHRIDPERRRHLVHRALKREQVRHLRRRLHWPGRVAVHSHHPLRRRDRQARIKRGGDVRALHREIIEPRRDRLRVMRQRHEPPVLVRAQPYAVPRLAAMVGDREAVAPPDVQVHRPPRPTRRQRAQRRVLRQRHLRPEVPADQRRHHPHPLRRDPQLRRQPVPRRADKPRRLPDRQLLAHPPADRVGQLDRIVVLHRRRIPLVHHLRRSCEPPRQIPRRAVLIPLVQLPERNPRRIPVPDPRLMRPRHVLDPQRARPRLRLLQRLCDHDRDNLPRIPNLRRRQRPRGAVRPPPRHQVPDRAHRLADLGKGEHVEHARQREHRVPPDRNHPPPCDRAAHQPRVRHPRELHIPRVRCPPGDLVRPVDPRHGGAERGVARRNGKAAAICHADPTPGPAKDARGTAP